MDKHVNEEQNNIKFPKLITQEYYWTATLVHFYPDTQSKIELIINEYDPTAALVQIYLDSQSKVEHNFFMSCRVGGKVQSDQKMTELSWYMMYWR